VEEFQHPISMDEIRSFFAVSGGGLRENGIGPIRMSHFRPDRIYELCGASPVSVSGVAPVLLQQLAQVAPIAANSQASEKVLSSSTPNTPSSGNGKEGEESSVQSSASSITTPGSVVENKSKRKQKMKPQKPLFTARSFDEGRMLCSKTDRSFVLLFLFNILLALAATIYIFYTTPTVSYKSWNELPTRTPAVFTYAMVVCSFAILAMFH